MINLIPMAGAGSRFAKEGYALPKPLISVSGKPMIVRASDSLPRAEKWIYICREEHIADYGVDKVLRAYAPDVAVLTVPALTEGQAATCLLAKDLINNDESLMIGACDNGAVWDRQKFDALTKEADCLVWTFRNNVTVQNKPKQYGWVRVDEKGNVGGVSVKVPISDTPISDHAVVGTFWFRRGRDFVMAAEDMIRKNTRVNGEFYVDECINNAIALGLRVKVFEVEKYICWGTPEDLKRFEYWDGFFRKYDRFLNRKK